MESLHLCFQPGERIPHEGETIIMSGLVVKYAVTIHKIQRTITGGNGTTLVICSATKRQLTETTPIQAALFEEGK